MDLSQCNNEMPFQPRRLPETIGDDAIAAWGQYMFRTVSVRTPSRPLGATCTAPQVARPPVAARSAASRSTSTRTVRRRSGAGPTARPRAAVAAIGQLSVRTVVCTCSVGGAGAEFRLAVLEPRDRWLRPGPAGNGLPASVIRRRSSCGVSFMKVESVPSRTPVRSTGSCVLTATAPPRRSGVCDQMPHGPVRTGVPSSAVTALRSSIRSHRPPTRCDPDTRPVA